MIDGPLRWRGNVGLGSLLGGGARLLFTVIGVMAIMVGSYLPWMQASPGSTVVPDILLSGMTSGFEAIHIVLVVPAVATVGAVVLETRPRIWASLSVLTGLAASVLPLALFIRTVGQFGSTFIPDVGMILTLVGGLVLLVIGALGLKDSRSGGERDSPVSSKR